MQEITSGGAESVLEYVGNQSAMVTAIKIARPGGAIGYVRCAARQRTQFQSEPFVYE